MRRKKIQNSSVGEPKSLDLIFSWSVRVACSGRAYPPHASQPTVTQRCLVQRLSAAMASAMIAVMIMVVCKKIIFFFFKF